MRRNRPPKRTKSPLILPLRGDGVSFINHSDGSFCRRWTTPCRHFAAFVGAAPAWALGRVAWLGGNGPANSRAFLGTAARRGHSGALPQLGTELSGSRDCGRHDFVRGVVGHPRDPNPRHVPHPLRRPPAVRDSGSQGGRDRLRAPHDHALARGLSALDRHGAFGSPSTLGLGHGAGSRGGRRAT